MAEALVASSHSYQADVKPRAFAKKLPSRRIEAIDLARGIAVALMILSHGVKGLIGFEDFPAWGLVPIHLITKFSSSLFIVVFGVSLAAAVAPAVGTADWPTRRRKLLMRGLVIFFWYKVLTFVEMFHLYSREDILLTLTYQAFPVYVEILGFYAIALLWVPLVLPTWMKIGNFVRIGVIAALALLSHYLYLNFDFWGSEPLQAILVEHEKHYAWGQLSRAPLIFMGFMIGQAVVVGVKNGVRGTTTVALSLFAVSGLFFCLFALLAHGDMATALHSVALNEGKHPPEQAFMLFSLSGAFAILGLCVGGRRAIATILKPFTIIGKDALQAFIFHIVVIFVGYRYLFDLWRNVSYSTALTLAVALIFATAVWVQITLWVKRWR